MTSGEAKITILDKIRENAGAFPERQAYHYEGKTDRFDLTWGELDRFSDALAVRIDREILTKKPVIVYGHKHPFMIVCFLACAKTGRAYCPIDISVPENRVRSIVDTVEPELILDVSDKDLFSAEDPRVWKKSLIENVVADPAEFSGDHWIQAEDVFYIIFTSGSTGTPKGVQITRDCLDNFIRWGMTLGSGIRESEDTIIFNTAPFSFDLSVMDLYLSLYAGGTLWTIDKELFGNIRNVTGSIGDSRASVIVATPSFMDMCFADRQFSAESAPKLRQFLFCGETLSNTLADRIAERFPQAEIVNTYGPTESTVAITDVTVTDEIGKAYNPLPVGCPKPGTWISIENEKGQSLPEGEKGEIVIIGDSVSVGYYKQPELTEKAFGEREINGRIYRSYKTGDEGYLKDSFLFYCGRIDLQIKLNGYRIEIEDVESNLMKISGVDRAVVVPEYKGTEVRRLIAFILPTAGLPMSEISIDAIRERARAFLPEYMIPKKLVLVDEIPMTGNGKADRKKLREIYLSGDAVK